LRREGEKDKPVRIKTRRFKGVLSQGLALPLSIFETHGCKIIEENGEFYIVG
jgi:hypothetical protein